MDWSLYPNFSQQELRCKHTKECNMHPDMMSILQSIRTVYGKPIFISSGFRSVKHPVEQMKEKPGEHTLGMAVDIICYHRAAIELLGIALQLGVRRIGVHQKGDERARYIHIGIADKLGLEYPPAIWTY